jgi:flagellar basal-body rod protein FlgB
MIDRYQQTLAFQGDALKLRAQRQQVLAANIANADTPGYQAVDFDFTRALTDATRSRAAGGAASAAGAMSTASASPQLLAREGAQAAADGNTVNMDTERAQFLDNAVRYEATLKFINGRIRTLLSAIQGQ